MAVRCFTDVTIGFPQGGGRPGMTEPTSPSTTWVIWTTGELRLDSASFALFFTPAKSARGSLAAKPLGCLLKADPMAPSHPGDSDSFVVTTNDPVHCVMRLGFARRGDEDAFMALAQAAEAAGASRFFRDSTGRRSSLRASMAPVEPAGTCDELAMQIRQRHPDKWLALTFGGCELYGPQPGGDRSIEVLLGRGAVALLDPKDVGRVGNFEIIFYDEGAAEPLFRAGIGPRTSLTLQPQDDRTGRLSVASRRLSARPAGAGMAFDLSPNGTDLLALSFDDDTIGDSFARDLTVRIKLAALSQKTWRGKQALVGLQGEIQALQSRGFFATLRRWIVQALLVFTFLVALHAGSLYMAQPEEPVANIFQTALSDAVTVASSASSMVTDVGATVCQMTARSISATDLERCTAMMDGIEVRDCVASVVASAKVPPSSATEGFGNIGSHFSALGKDYINLGLSGLGSSL